MLRKLEAYEVKNRKIAGTAANVNAELIAKFPLDPYDISDPKPSVRKYFADRKAFEQGVQAETIINSVYSEHVLVRHSNFNTLQPGDPYLFYLSWFLRDTSGISTAPRPSKVNWFTLAPYRKGPRGCKVSTVQNVK